MNALGTFPVSARFCCLALVFRRCSAKYGNTADGCCQTATSPDPRISNRVPTMGVRLEAESATRGIGRRSETRRVELNWAPIVLRNRMASIAAGKDRRNMLGDWK